MKMERRAAASALTLVEFLVVLTVIVMLLAMLLPALSGGGPRDKPHLAVCRVNLNQTARGSTMWASDHEGQFPWQISVTNGGTLESAAGGRVVPSFHALSDYLSAQSARLVCPSDKTKRPATNFATLTEQNISHFLDLDSVMHSTNSILSGDRHLQLNGQPVKPGVSTVTTNTAVSWTKELHYSGKLLGGNLAFADGHVQYTRESLQRIIRQQPQATNRFLIP